MAACVGQALGKGTLTGLGLFLVDLGVGGHGVCLVCVCGGGGGCRGVSESDKAGQHVLTPTYLVYIPFLLDPEVLQPWELTVG